MTSARPRYWPILAAAAIAGVSYWLLGQHTIPEPQWVVWKASGVALLALWAALNARGRDGWLIAAVLALGAIGDAVIEYSQTNGALAFLAGHIVAVALYGLNRRHKFTPSQIALAAMLLVATPVIAFLLPANRSAVPGVALYATGLGAMAATAWMSRFPRYRVGIGAVLFVISDLLIFSRMGPLQGSIVPNLLVWPLYFAGQVLIAWGVVTILLRWKADEDLHHRL